MAAWMHYHSESARILADVCEHLDHSWCEAHGWHEAGDCPGDVDW